MKNFFYLLFAFLLCGFALQRSVAQTMIINELSNGASGSKEFVEFLVTGSCGQTLDIRGWYFDDNCTSPGAANGNGRFANITQWAAVPVGSIIVIYNEGDLNAALPPADPTDANCDGVYVIPTSSNVLQFQTAALASCAASSYTATTGYVTGTATSWTVVSLANGGDAFQLRNSSGVVQFSVAYGTATGGTVTFATSGTGSCFRFTGVAGSDPTNVANWTANTNAATVDSPGKANNCNNAAFIEALLTVKDNEFKVAGCPNITATNTTLCVGATATKALTGCTSDSYAWSTSDAGVAIVSGTGQNATITAVSAGTANIIVTVTHTYTNLYLGLTGCSATPIVKTMTYPVTVNANPTLSLAPSCAGGAGTGVLTPTFTAGAGGSPSYNPASLSSLADGTYTVTVTESGSGCTAIASGTISCAASCGALADAPVGTITPASFCQTGGALTGSTAESTAPTSFDYELVYLLVDDATGIIVSNDFTVDALIAPDNNGTTVKTYSVYALVYESAQGVDIINGTTTITVGDADVIKDLDGDPLAATPSATACMDLSPAAATTVAVNPKPTLTDDIDDLNCSGTSAAIDLQSNVSGTTVTWTAALTSGTATGFSDNATPTTVDNAASTNEINTTLTNTGTTNAVVTYTITPTANGCAGSNYVVPLTIFPPLVISTAPVCNGATLYDVTFAMTGGGGSGYSVSNNATGTLNYSSPDANGTVTAIPLATTLTLNVTDDEGCVATKNTVLNDCNASISISDPCTCNGDQSANGAQDGTFGETVTVTGTGTGQTWTVIAVSTLSGSGTLPTATVGTVLTADIGNNYVTTFSHTDDTGYSLVIEGPNALVGAGVVGSPQVGNQQLTISNLCQYPEAVFSPTFNATYCLPVSPITLAAYEVNSMAGSMTYSGTDVSGTTFAPTIAQPYTVTATFTSIAGTGLGGTVLAPATPDNACSTQVFQNTTVANCPGCAPVGGTW